MSRFPSLVTIPSSMLAYWDQGCDQERGRPYTKKSIFHIFPGNLRLALGSWILVSKINENLKKIKEITENPRNSGNPRNPHGSQREFLGGFRTPFELLSNSLGAATDPYRRTDGPLPWQRRWRVKSICMTIFTLGIFYFDKFWGGEEFLSEQLPSR